MKGIRISFRLSPYQIARGLEIIRRLEPKYKYLSANEIVRTIYHDYIAKMSINRSGDIPTSLLTEVLNQQTKSPQEKLTLDNLMTEALPGEPSTKPEETDNTSEKTIEALTNFIKEPEINLSGAKPSDFDDPNDTDSSISSLTDFSPPKNWMD